MVENKAFKIAGIKLLMVKNYAVDVDLVDLESLVDDSLSMSENWFNTVKPKVLALCEKPCKILWS